MSSFGEISEPGSRTAWEDWDDNVREDCLQLRWTKKVDTPERMNTLLVLEGKYLADCVRSKTECKLEIINSISEVNLRLLKTESNDYVCLVKDYNLVWSSEIVELLKPYITESHNVVAVITKPLVEYQIPELTTQDCIIRALPSTRHSAKYSDIRYPKLEQPNIISGIAAGVISLREHLDLPALALVCYIEHPEEHRVTELHKLLAKLNIVAHGEPKNDIINSNLYI